MKHPFGFGFCSRWFLIRSCVSIFSSGFHSRSFRGLKRAPSTTMAVTSHARPYELGEPAVVGLLVALKIPAGWLGMDVVASAWATVLKAPDRLTIRASLRYSASGLRYLLRPGWIERSAPFSPPKRVGHTPPQPIAMLTRCALTARSARHSSIRRPHFARSPARYASHPSRSRCSRPSLLTGRFRSPLAFRGLPPVALAAQARSPARADVIREGGRNGWGGNQS